jgi:hypothetical protein
MNQRILYRVDPLTDEWIRIPYVYRSLPDSHREPRRARSVRGQLLNYAALGVLLTLVWLAYGWIIWRATVGGLM